MRETILGRNVVVYVIIFACMFVTAIAGDTVTKDVIADDISDEELQKFVRVNMRLMVIQQQAEEQMIRIIEQNGLTPDRYNEIAIMENSPQIESNATDEELEKARKISDSIEGIQNDFHNNALVVLAEEGLTPQRYEEIGITLQLSPELQQRYDQLMENEG